MKKIYRKPRCEITNISPLQMILKSPGWAIEGKDKVDVGQQEGDEDDDNELEPD